MSPTETRPVRPSAESSGSDSSASPASSSGVAGEAPSPGPARPSHGGQQPADHHANKQVAPKLTVPDRPTLAPGVRLAGQMRESAFKNPPWLIEREGVGYVQVTELLYRIAELCDGTRTLAEVAQAVSERTGRSVSEENVRLLLGTQLVLKGLVPSGDGRVVGGQGGTRSLLALSLRTKMIEPELLEAPTALLRWLFFPPVLIATVLLALAGLGWLLLAHGSAAGAREALYTPGLLLIALGLTAAAAGFHELGHAAALRYGGGRPKGMGVGLYLVYPAFYTDVSDNYRLGRWARVRTDLGGVYFHLVFMLGILGLYLATGWEPLLIGVPLLLLDAFRQLLPLIRLDGYWTLADLTGVPDFLSHVGAFVKRFLPGRQEPSSLPELKWWGTAAFALYIVIILPLLAFMLLTMVRTTPTILATAWDSAGQLWSGLQQALGHGDILSAAASAAQLLVLALPTAGLLYSLGRFGVRLGKAIWHWSSPTPMRRAIGALGTLGTLGLVAYLWAPQLPFGDRSGPLYEPTRASFVPIPPDVRGTLFDAVGVPQPAWTGPAATSDEQRGEDPPLAAPSPSPMAPGSGGMPPAAASPTPAAPAGIAGTPASVPTAGAPPATAAIPLATRPANPPATAVVAPQPTTAAPQPTAPARPPLTQPQPTTGAAPALGTPALTPTPRPAGVTPTALRTPTSAPAAVPTTATTPTSGPARLVAP
jgi:putative peptide zinc metalloprotease protein